MIDRRTMLRGMAATAGGGALASVALTGSAAARPELKIKKIANLTGPGLTDEFGMPWTDLGIPARTPDGRTLYVFGDTFRGPDWGQGEWMSPTGLWSETRGLPGGVTFSAAVGGDEAQQLVDYQHGDEISTIIPSDVITIGDTMYLHGVANQGFGNAIWSGIWTSTDSGATWQDSGARFDATAYDGAWQLCTWELGADGWLYMYSAEFLREGPMILHRVRPEHITDPDQYIPWGRDASGWGWGKPATPLSDEIIGEMCLRRFGDKWLLTWFNNPDYRIEAKLLDHPTQPWEEGPRVTLLHGTSWGEEDDTHVAQLYGSYIIPGSRLDDIHMTVSQWNTGDNSIYRVMQWRVQGLAGLR
ncbi:DUF4185 domain-containing protein [Georgenia deserti]|uniref:DUF4185 domain-containing protein n=1 Tax=Georgenia deserti TaxID=2093781 RepID=A0ABW4L5F4_9MICO